MKSLLSVEVEFPTIVGVYEDVTTGSEGGVALVEVLNSISIGSTDESTGESLNVSRSLAIGSNFYTMGIFYLW